MSSTRAQNTNIGLIGALTAFVASSLVWSIPLFLNRFAWTADIFAHYQWAAQFESALREGVLIPRWAALSHQGLGDATFSHIHPLFYYLACGVNVAIGNLWTSMKLVVVLSHLVLGCGIYRLVHRNFGKTSALLAGLTAQWMPYHFFLIDYSQAFPTLLAIAIMALVLDAVFQNDTKLTWISAVSFLVCGVVVAHILVAFTLLVSLSLAIFLATVVKRKETTRYDRLLVNWSIAAILGLGLSGWYWIPAVFGRSMINPQGWALGQWLLPHLAWDRNFIFPLLTALTEGSTSTAILWLSPVPLVFINLYAITHTKIIQLSLLPRYNRQIFAIAVLTSLISIFLSSGTSWLIWEYVPPFQQLQFPWRFLGISGLASAIIIGVFFSPGETPPRSKRIGYISLLSCVLITLALAAQALYGGKTVVPDNLWLVGNFGQPEYLPAWVPASQANKNDGANLCRGASERCTIVIDGSHEKIFRTKLYAHEKLTFPLYFHPGWRATIEETTTVELVPNIASGLVEASIPAGQNLIRMYWEGTSLEKAGAWVSFISLILVIMLPIAFYSLLHGPGNNISKLCRRRN